MKGAHWIGIAAVFAFTGVALGAFGAHALAARFGDYEKAIWQTAVFYHLVHAVALFAFGVAIAAAPGFRESLGEGGVWIAGLAFTAGTVFFSGSLYALALSGVRVLGAITPLGGVAYLAGWVTIARAAFALAGRGTGP